MLLLRKYNSEDDSTLVFQKEPSMRGLPLGAWVNDKTHAFVEVDGSIIVDKRGVNHGDIIKVGAVVSSVPPVTFSVANGYPTPPLLNRLIAWGIARVESLGATLRATCLGLSGRVWDAKGIPVSNIGDPVDDSCACPLGLAKALSDARLEAINSDMRKLAAAVGQDVGSVKKKFSARLKGINNSINDISNGYLDVQDMLRNFEKSISSIGETVAKSVSTHGAKIWDINSKLEELKKQQPKDKPKTPRDAATVGDLGALASAVQTDMRKLEALTRADIEDLVAAMATELRELGLRLVALENKSKEKKHEE